MQSKSSYKGLDKIDIGEVLNFSGTSDGNKWEITGTVLSIGGETKIPIVVVNTGVETPINMFDIEKVQHVCTINTGLPGGRCLKPAEYTSTGNLLDYKCQNHMIELQTNRPDDAKKYIHF